VRVRREPPARLLPQESLKSRILLFLRFAGGKPNFEVILNDVRTRTALSTSVAFAPFASAKRLVY